jgi:hypothetical protein
MKAKANGDVRKVNFDRPLFSNETKAIVWGMQTKVNLLTKNDNRSDVRYLLLGCSRYA